MGPRARRPEADLPPVVLKTPEFRQNGGRQKHFNLTGDLKFAVQPAIRYGVRGEPAPVDGEDAFVLFESLLAANANHRGRQPPALRAPFAAFMPKWPLVVRLCV